MSTYSSLRVHIVFSTKDRRPTLPGESLVRIHAYMGGCLKSLECVPEAIGGIEDHVHLLIGLRTKHAPSDVVRELKKASTTWIREQLKIRDFAWQEGYAVISVSPADKPMICGYIAKQAEHHRKVSSYDELREILREAGIEYDPAYFA